MQSNEHRDSHVYIAVLLAGIAAYVSTTKTFPPGTALTFSPTVLFGEAIPWDPAAQSPNITVPP